MEDTPRIKQVHRQCGAALWTQYEEMSDTRGCFFARTFFFEKTGGDEIRRCPGCHRPIAGAEVVSELQRDLDMMSDLRVPMPSSAQPSPGAKSGSCPGLASRDETAGKSGRLLTLDLQTKRKLPIGTGAGPRGRRVRVGDRGMGGICLGK